MSNVTNVILCTGFIEDSVIGELNKWLDGLNKGVLLSTGEFAGGRKFMEVRVWQAAFNYLDTRVFIEKWRGMSWISPEEIQLMIKEQENDLFVIYTLDASNVPGVG